MMRFFLVLFSCAALLPSARAGQSIDFFRVTCLPESGYFSVEHKPIDNANVFWGPYSKLEGQEKVLGDWRKNGFYEGSFTYTCRMTQGVYVATVSRAEFSERRCGAAPQVRLTLSSNNTPVISDAVFGADCWGNNSISSIEIVEGHEGWASTDMNLCFYKDGFLPFACSLSAQAYWKLDASHNVDQSKVDDYVKSLGR